MSEQAKKSVEEQKNKNMSSKKVIVAIVVIAAVLCLTVGAIVGGSGAKSRGKLPDEPIPEEFMTGLAADDAERTEDTDTRVMSLNLMKQNEDRTPDDVPSRAKMFLETLSTFTPDVIGLQQVDADWFDCLSKNLPNNYRFSNKSQNKKTVLIYNTALLKQIEQGDAVYEQGTDEQANRIEWALFERMDSGNRFLVIVTEFDALHEESMQEDLAIMQSETEELTAFASELYDRYDCPVILAGSFHATEDTDKTTATDAKDIYTELANQFRDAKKHSYRAKSGNGWSLSEPIGDHIFLMGENKIERYRLISNLYIKSLSDSFPIYADFEIKTD